MNIRHLMRMSRLARHPPSWRRVLLGAGVVALCLALAGLERLGLFPKDLPGALMRPAKITAQP